MGILYRIKNKIDTALNADTDPINRARVYILFYTLSFSVVFTFILTIVYLINGPVLQLIRIIICFTSLSCVLYQLILKHNWKPAAHVVLAVLAMLIWSNIFLIIQAVNIVTIQYILLMITCSFYLLNGFWRIFHSIISLLPVVLYFILHNTVNIQVFVSPQQASNSVFVAVMMFNFFLMIFIHYHFLKAFYFTLSQLSRLRKEEMLLNERLKEAITIAEQSSKSKSDFLSTMSHELRTPLNSVIGMSYVLLADNPRKDQEESLKILRFSAESLLTLINDILDFNKIEYGRIELERIEFSPSELVRNIYTGFKVQAEEKDLNLILHLNDNLSGIHVLGDPTRLSQILFNLVGNAIKFTSAGYVELSASLVNSQEPNHVTLAFKVKDSGIGIPEDKQGIIFEPFSQASNNITRKFGGTGLGLAIIKQLLELHNSRIRLSSEVGKGTSFEFNIRYELTNRNNTHPNSDATANSANTDLSDLKILVAEDNMMNVLLMRKLFSAWNINADFVENGLEAVEAAKNNSYDVILMDIHMPVMDGYEASKSIFDLYRNNDVKPRIIALTASVANDTAHKINEAGLNDYLSKPFNPVELKNKLAAIVKPG